MRHDRCGARLLRCTSWEKTCLQVYARTTRESSLYEDDTSQLDETDTCSSIQAIEKVDQGRHEEYPHSSSAKDLREWMAGYVNARPDRGKFYGGILETEACFDKNLSPKKDDEYPSPRNDDEEKTVFSEIDNENESRAEIDVYEFADVERMILFMFGWVARLKEFEGGSLREDNEAESVNNSSCLFCRRVIIDGSVWKHGKDVSCDLCYTLLGDFHSYDDMCLFGTIYKLLHY